MRRGLQLKAPYTPTRNLMPSFGALTRAIPPVPRLRLREDARVAQQWAALTYAVSVGMRISTARWASFLCSCSQSPVSGGRERLLFRFATPGDVRYAGGPGRECIHTRNH